jgi:hypothetical protein
MDDFKAQMSPKTALRLYLFLEAREEELAGGAEELYAALRAYLYENLSIQDMEQPEILLKQLEND